MKNQKGFSLVELLVVVIIIAIIAAIAIPNLLASRRAANEASAISSLRTIHSAEATYQATLGANVQYGMMTDLGTAGLIDTVLAAATGTNSKSGYTFTDGVTAVTQVAYCVSAAPVGATTGTRAFGVSSDGVIYTSLPDGTNAPTCAAGVLTLNSALPLQ